MILAFWPNRRWYIPSRLGHITILDYVNETWLQIDVNRHDIDIIPFFSKDEVEDRISRLTMNCTLIQWDRRKAAPGYLRPMTCVTFARYYSGVPSRALFPDGLMRDFLRNGAEVIHGAKNAERVE